MHALGINKYINMYSHNPSSRNLFLCYDILMDCVIHIMGSTNKYIPPNNPPPGWSLLIYIKTIRTPTYLLNWAPTSQVLKFCPTIHALQLWSCCKHAPNLSFSFQVSSLTSCSLSWTPPILPT